MARKIRIVPKKRGSRRTGSKKLGRVGEALFFGLFCLLGLGGLVLIVATLLIPEWRANHVFARQTCLVLDKRIGQKEDDDGTLYRPEVKIEYQIEGKTYRVWTYDIHTIRGGGYGTEPDDAEAIVDRFVQGEHYAVYYDPADANVAVLWRGPTRWVWLTLLVPVSFLLIGGGGLVYRVFTWGKSTERRAAIVKQAAQMKPFADPKRSQPDFPGVPVPTDVTDSPGTRLAFRLPAAGAPAWALWVWLVSCLLWNGIVSVFVVVAINSFLRGDPDWFLAAFILPFVVIGIGLIVLLARQFLVTTGIGPTLVEISDQPLYPGQKYRLFLSQTGRLKIDWLELLLVCDGEATYRQGTDTRTESCRVCERSLHRADDFEVTGAAPFETECDLQLPSGAMHSFKSEHNGVAWKILVRGSPVRWPDFERSFPVIVYPGSGGKGEA